MGFSLPDSRQTISYPETGFEGRLVGKQELPEAIGRSIGS